MKKIVGTKVAFSLSPWRGSKVRDGRNTGLMLRIGPTDSSYLWLQIELPIAEAGKLLANESAEGTVEFAATSVFKRSISMEKKQQ